MARHTMKMTDIGEGVVDCEIVAWLVKPGDAIAEDQHFVDVMTDKATVEMSAPVAGVVAELCAEAGARVAVGAPLIIIETDAATAVSAPAAPSAVAPAAEPEPESTPAPEPAPVAAPAPLQAPAAAAVVAPARAVPGSDDRAIAAPAIRRRAREAHVDLALVPATGRGGRISHEDLDAYIAGARAAPTPAPAQKSVALPAARAPAPSTGDGTRTLKVIGLRRVIAEKMSLSKRRIPHYSYVEEVDLTELEVLRQHLNANRREGQPKLTYLPFLIKALCKALRDFPQCNAHFDDEAGVVTQFDAAHVGVATQTPNGLMVPVVHHADALDLWQVAAEMQRVSEAARTGKATRQDLSGSTITITSLGKLGGLASTPVINHPEVAILGINKSEMRAVVRDGEIVARLMMNLSASFDHRIVDGFDGASLVQSMKTLLEYPATIFV